MSLLSHSLDSLHFEKYVNTYLKANLIGGRVRAHALKGKINFTVLVVAA
jgi:hypothetical protein